MSLLWNWASLHLLAPLVLWADAMLLHFGGGGVNHCIGLGQMPEQEGISFNEAVRW